MVLTAKRSYCRRKHQSVARVAPPSFVADLQHLRNWPMMRGSLWGRATFVELTHKPNCELLTAAIKGKNLEILDVGCGTGFISLELARRGHNVLGLDKNETMVEIAKRSRDKTGNSVNGRLEYDVANFDKWSGTKQSYDVVLFSRVLHDLPKPRNVLIKAHHLLKKHGQLVCLEYAYDMKDRIAVQWLYQIRKTLEIQGLYASPHLSDDPEEGVAHILEEATIERKEHINTFKEMNRPLKQLFHQELFSWHPYYFWDILTDLRVPNPKVEERLASMIKSMEEYLLRTRRMHSELFLYKGRKS